MQITRIEIRKVAPEKGLAGFASCIIDDWLYIGNIAIFTRLNQEGKIRLVFPEKKIKNKKIRLFHPLSSKEYFILEDAIKQQFFKVC